MTRRALFMATGANRGAWYAGFMAPLADAGIEIGRSDMQEAIAMASSTAGAVVHGTETMELRTAMKTGSMDTAAKIEMLLD